MRIWRPPHHPRLLAMHDVTSRYAGKPAGQYVIGLIQRSSLRASRGRTHHDLHPGDLGVWDPSGEHRGAPLADAAWECRLLSIQVPDVNELLADPDTCLPDLEFPDPVVRSRPLATRFLRLHRLLAHPASALEVDTALAELFDELLGHSPVSARRKDIRVDARKDPALRTACEYLRDRLDDNTTLDELAAVAGVGKFRLARLFRAGTGLGPHGFQVAVRLRRALSLLDQGIPAVHVATVVGFHDQSHLHRHFLRAFGLTPRQYAAWRQGCD